VVKKVYCKKDYLGLLWERNYYKYKHYYIKEGYWTSEKLFVFTHLDKNDIPENGLWFDVDVFEEHFTYDITILRQEKLKRITNE